MSAWWAYFLCNRYSKVIPDWLVRRVYGCDPQRLLTAGR